MKYGVLCFWAAICLLLAGCSDLPAQATGPQGGGEPQPLNGGEERQPREALPPRRPMARRRRNAAQGRLAAPDDSFACGGACGCGSCDYPLWLYAAQSKEGLYMGLDTAALRCGQNGAPAQQAGFAPMLKFSRSAAEAVDSGAVFPAAERSALFADYCLAQTANSKTGGAYPRLAAGAARAENWLSYGAAAKPCFGALMIAEEGGRFQLAFCVGALRLAAAAPAGGGAQAAREQIIYLGFSVKTVSSAAGGGSPAGRIGLAAFAAAAVRGFRLPPNYRPCKEHYKLDYTFWAEQFRAQIAAKRGRKRAETEGGGQIAASARQSGAFVLPPAPAFASSAAASETAEALGDDWAARGFSPRPEPPRYKYS